MLQSTRELYLMVMVIQMNGLPKQKDVGFQILKQWLRQYHILQRKRLYSFLKGRMSLTGLNLSHVLR